MKANSEKTKQSKKATRRVLAGVLCGASVLSLVLSLVMPPISQAIANDGQAGSTGETVTVGGSSTESTDVGNTSEDAENQNNNETDDGEADSSNSVEQAQSANAASARATATVGPGIYVPTSIGVGTDVTTAQNDPSVATFVGRDMYVGEASLRTPPTSGPTTLQVHMPSRPRALPSCRVSLRSIPSRRAGLTRMVRTIRLARDFASVPLALVRSFVLLRAASFLRLRA